MDTITPERLTKYFKITEEALDKAKSALENVNITETTRKEFLEMVENYLSDAKHFCDKGDLVTAFAALNYAHGWLDAGATIGLWDVDDNRLFTVDG